MTFSFSHNTLAIECTHQCISVAVGSPEGVFEETLREWQRTAESIVPLVHKVLALAEKTIDDIDLLALSSGPGSFTALRIGMATAKGFAYGAGVPLVTVSTIEALAESARHHHDASCLVPVIPARKGEFYYAVYTAGNDGLKVLEKTSYVPVEKLEKVLEGQGDQCVVVARNIVPLEESCRSAGVEALQAEFFTAASLLPLAEKTYAAGEVPPLETVAPGYMQNFRSKG